MKISFVRIHSTSNLEPCESALRKFVTFLDAVDVFVEGSFNLVQEERKHLLRTLHNELDRPVWTIPDVASDGMLLRDAKDRLAKADSLDASAEDDMPALS